MKNRRIRMMLLALAVGVFLLASLMVSKYFVEMQAGAEQDQELAHMVSTTVPQETEVVTEPVEQPLPEETIPEETEPVQEDYVKVVAPIQVDFDALLAESPDVVGWLYCPDTKINYPVAQAEDNDYYLDHLLNGRPNGRGNLFLDYRNESDFSHWNSVIYGHNMNNKTMFGTLTGYKRQAYFDAHPQMYLLTPEGDYLIKLVAGLVVRPESEIFQLFDPDVETKDVLLQTWLEESTFNSPVEPTLNDRLITLSTCTYEFKNARYVVIGVLTDRAE